MTPDVEFEPVALRNGDELSVSADDNIVVHRSSADGRAIALTLEYPSAGVGGGFFVLSPYERYAVLAMYSGQSEERYDLLLLSDGLSRVDGIDYQYGERATYGSPLMRNSWPWRFPARA